jgi:hypothetical protein
MKAKGLKRDDLFTVDKPDPECSQRVCLDVYPGGMVVWGWPGNKSFWGLMGPECDVTLVERAEPKE